LGVLDLRREAVGFPLESEAYLLSGIHECFLCDSGKELLIFDGFGNPGVVVP
jgi:hypothetical protein